MPVERRSNRYRVRVVVADYDPTAGLVLVCVRHGEHEMIDLHHYQRLDKISIDGVSHPRPASFDFEAATPLCMVGIDLIFQCRHSILTVENGTLDFVPLQLAVCTWTASRTSIPRARNPYVENNLGRVTRPNQTENDPREAEFMINKSSSLLG